MLATDRCVKRFGFSVVPWTRGESVFLVETPVGYLALVVEGLGTKNLVADAMYQIAQKVGVLDSGSFYDRVTQCNVAMAVNDMITLGALPICYGQYLAVGSSDWFKDKKRCHDLIEGTTRACFISRCTWAGGETPTLKGIIEPGAADLSGATMGFMPKERLINPENIRHGDAILLFESSGIHANGLTLARTIADKLPKGYMTMLDDGRTYGETLLEPTHIYVGLVEDCQDAGVDIHYAVNITGHGWRKLMRANQPFAYVIKNIPQPSALFEFIQKYGPVDDREAYANFNMGAGFALYVPQEDVQKVRAVVDEHVFEYGFGMIAAGHVEKSETKRVVIEPKELVYEADTLAVR
jgi:phosphoribosylformylglycinamidine cyclo-ligase